MCGFLGGTIINSSVDAATGYATTEIWPRWGQRQPLPINRWQTLIIKWVMAAVLTGLLTRADATGSGRYLADGRPPRRAAVAAGMAVFGERGRRDHRLVRGPGSLHRSAPGHAVVCLRGTGDRWRHRALQALPSVLQPLAQVEPLRQILDGARAILYFDAQADAGLTRAVTAASLGLVFWLVLGAVVVRWYDRKGFNRMDPELLAYVGGSVQQYKSRNADARQQDTGNAGRQTKPYAQV